MRIKIAILVASGGEERMQKAMRELSREVVKLWGVGDMGVRICQNLPGST